MVLKLKDGRKELYQWDVGVVADVTDENINEVHFSNLRYGVSFNIEVQNGTVTIPPEVLQSGADVFCWAFVRGENGGYTKKEQIFNVEKRPRPADYIYEPTEVLTWETLKQEIEDVEKGTIKIITGPCHIAELEPGTYVVKNGLAGDEYDGKVTFSNVKADDTIDESYFSLESGLLVVFENIKSRETDGSEISIVAFTAQGSISVPNQSYGGGFLEANYTIKNATNVTCYFLESTKLSEKTELFEANKWCSSIPLISFSDIPASAIKNEITTESTIYDVPSALAVKNYVNESINALQGNLDEVSALVGGA